MLGEQVERTEENCQTGNIQKPSSCSGPFVITRSGKELPYTRGEEREWKEL